MVLEIFTRRSGEQTTPSKRSDGAAKPESATTKGKNNHALMMNDESFTERTVGETEHTSTEFGEQLDQDVQDIFQSVSSITSDNISGEELEAVKERRESQRQYLREQQKLFMQKYLNEIQRERKEQAAQGVTMKNRNYMRKALPKPNIIVVDKKN